MISIFHDVEKLKKEMWYLNKVIIPKLEQDIKNIAGFDPTEILSSINYLKDQVSKLSENVTEHQGSISNHTTDISKLKQDFQNISSQVSELQNAYNTISGQIEELKKEHGQYSSKFSDIDANLSQISNSISAISQTAEQNKADISQAKEDISFLKNANLITNKSIEDINETVTYWSNRCNTFEKDISTLSGHYTNLVNLHNTLAFYVQDFVRDYETDNTSMKSTLETLSTKVSALEGFDVTIFDEIQAVKTDLAQIKTQLENMSGGGGLDYDVLYDMNSSDPAINHGVTSGAVGGTTFMFDLKPYRYLRIFASVNSYECQDFIKITDRNRTDFTLMSMSANMKTINFLKYAIPLTLDRIQFSTYATYTYNSSKFSFASYELGKTNENFFAYRIEGVK